MTATSCEDVRIPPISDDVESSDEEYNPEISSDDEEEEDELEDIEVDRDEEIDNEEGIDEVVEEGGSTVRTQSVIEGEFIKKSTVTMGVDVPCTLGDFHVYV